MFGKTDWIVFQYINGLNVSGNGAFDGQGALTWSQNQCSKKEKGGKCTFPIGCNWVVTKLEIGILMAEAVSQGADRKITIGGIQSNHCRATAVAAKYLNLDCYLILRTSKVFS
ncbi:Bifunctional D-cysteine desulfhydrase/1-aminocyclopropane-1-carboxylate deaminase protein [Thalictrum thalictroides]|uniref:Bifunctional D-cysteine desulfhydrase/1-aminocyclopropane-1-carboxylate deaminase protein n=1 Tax=Thalictrum thalictroides TaxID=46969 RepID=A0A7J6VYG9_THATH|nr:Bifunctional D-cysteine desulfhydrase/1-aminocyclopropane-1-carboxylate deaminase protein [Thalictrum thalictroides]